MFSRYLLLAALFLLSLSSLAADKYWRPTNSDFFLATNWDPVGVPGAGDRVIIDQFGQVDMIIDADVSVAGWLQYNNYVEEVYLTNGSTLTVGSQNFFMDSGGFYGGDGTLDVNGHLEVHGGGFQSPAAACYVQGNLELNPYPLGGWFTDQTAYWALDGYQFGTLISNATINNLHVNKLGGYSFTIPDGMFLLVQGYTALLDGYLNGEGELRVDGDCLVDTGHDGGNLKITMVGSGTHVLDINKNNWDQTKLSIRRSTFSDTTRLVSLISGLDLLTTTDTLTVEEGVLQLDYFDVLSFNQANTYIEAGGTLLAPQGTLRIENHFDNVGGTFDHNQSTVSLYAYSFATLNSWEPLHFHNLQMQKLGGYSMTLPEGLEVRVENRMDFLDGYLQGPGILQIEDSLVVHSGYDIGTAPVEIVSSKVSNVIVNHTSNFFNAFDVVKDFSTDSVYFETQNSALQFGTGNNRLDVYSGVVAFKDFGTHVDCNLLNLEMHSGGTLEAPHGRLNYAGHFTESGGTFDHHMGTWVFDAATIRTIDVGETVEFYNLGLDKSSSYYVNVAAGDSLIALNKYTSYRGILNGPDAVLVAKDSVHTTTGHQRGNMPLVFHGSSDGHWIQDEVSSTFFSTTIDKSAGAKVWLESSLSPLQCGEVDETLYLREGELGFQNVLTGADLDYGSIYLESGSTLEAWQGTTWLAGNLYETGGSFDHNFGTWQFDTPRFTDINVSNHMEFYNLVMNKSSSYATLIADGDSLVALNKYVSARGILNGPNAVLVARDSVYTTSGHQRGSAPLVFNGSSDGHWIQDEVSYTFYSTTIDKSAGAKVWLESSLSPLQCGEVDETLYLREGELGFQNVLTGADLDYGSIYLEPGSTLEAWQGTTWLAGNLYETGGSFDHNFGTWQFDTPRFTDINVSNHMEFYNLVMNKSSSYATLIADGDSLVALNKYVSSRGILNGPNAVLVARDSVYTTSGHQRGSAPLVFNGSTDGHWIQDEVSYTFYSTIIDKSAGAKVWLESTLSPFQSGESDEVLTVREGELGFQNINSGADLNYGALHIEEGGTLEAWQGVSWFSGSLYVDNGTFIHNDGTWQFETATAASIDVTDEIRFWNLIMNKPSGYWLTASDSDELIAENKVSFVRGMINNPLALVVAEDSLVVYNTHNRGTTPVSMRGATPGTWIHDQSSYSFFDAYLEKDPGASVQLISSNTNLNQGEPDEDLHLLSGTLNVNHNTGNTDWDYGNVEIDGGSLQLPDVDLYVQSNLNLLGGNVLPGAGVLISDGYTATTWNLAVPMIVGDFVFQKYGGYSQTFTAGSILQVNDSLQFLDGYLNGGEVWAKGSVDVASTWDGGTFDISFTGEGDQVFDLTGSESKLEGIIEFNKPTGNVVLTSNLDIEDDFEQLVFTSGLLTYEDPATQFVRFLSIWSGWTGGNNTSYIDGYAEKWGVANTMLPVGNDGVFAPMGCQDLATYNSFMRGRYLHAAPPSGGLDAGIDHLSSCEHWEATFSDVSNISRVYLSYDTDRCGAINAESELLVARLNGGLWENLDQSSFDGSRVLSGIAPVVGGFFTLGSSTPNNPMDGSSAGCVTDLNNDGTHDTLDLLLLLGEFGCSSGCTYDITGDGASDTQDLLDLLGVFGSDC